MVAKRKLQIFDAKGRSKIKHECDIYSNKYKLPC